MADSFDGPGIARQRIAEEADRRTGFLDLGNLGLTELPAELAGLRHLRRLNLGSGFFAEDGSWQWSGSDRPNAIEGQLGRIALLPAIESFYVNETNISNLAPLERLVQLQTLFCFNTQVSDLSPLAAIARLQTLDCSYTQVSDLGPLAAIAGMQTLDCSITQVSDLGPLAAIAGMQTLDCSSTHVSDLSPLAEIAGLQTLNCSSTYVSDLSPLAAIAGLQTLNCSITQVSDLGPLAAIAGLQTLNCYSTQVSDLGPLAAIAGLQTLNCYNTQVSDLGPLAEIAGLQTLNCSGTRLTHVPDGFWEKPSLREAFLYRCHLPNVPAEVPSQELGDNCLESLRRHFADMAAGAAPITDVKLLVLGNGRVGKTQLCRRLRNEPFQEAWDSTHGVVVTSAALPSPTGEAARLHLWDFGGQDIYHGTHALFVHARAVFLLLWARDTENTDEYERDGIRFRNHPLAYWVDYVRHLGAADSPAVIVQTKCDKPADDARRAPVAAEALDALGYAKELQFGAPNDRGRAALEEALRDAIGWLRERQGTALIGAGRLRVQRKLEAMRDADAGLRPEQRQHRTLSQDAFRILCEEAEGVSSPGHLLDYLNNAGIVFHRPGLFNDAIVLDQAWALDAIYAVFNREKCYRELLRLGGRFSRMLLDALVWQEYGPEEQKLFLSMMESCGICFVHRGDPDDDAAEYIAPDLLPERATVEDLLAEKWDEAEPCESADFDYPFLPPGLAGRVIARIGREAGVHALYWRGGVCVYERTTRSHALVEQEMLEGWKGRIRLRTQHGQAATLLAQLGKWIEEESDRAGVRPVEVRRELAARRGEESAVPTLVFGQPEATQREWFVSYAWKDDLSPEGRLREAMVDGICERAKARGVRILRDRDTLGLGDRISAFMERIGRGDRIFVVLSEKYLRSRFCMFELFEIWRRCQAEEKAFLERVRVYAIPGTKISDPMDWSDCSVFWEQKFNELDARIRTNPSSVGKKGYEAFQQMGRFYRDVADIVATIADIVQPRTLEEFERYGFDDLPPAGQ